MPAQPPGGLQPPGKILSRRYPVGAEPMEGDRVAVRVWAPKRERVSIVFQPGMTGAETGRSDMRPVELMREGGGYFSAIVDEMPVGSRYSFLLDDDLTPYPDPASRFQPEGPHGPSQVVDASRFGWTDDAWKGRSIEGQVIYEMHIGTFTPEVTWQAALRELPRPLRLGL